MECFKKKNLPIKEVLLQNIELSKIEMVIPSDKEDFIKQKERHPWQFFLDTHHNSSDIGWWKKHRYI